MDLLRSALPDAPDPQTAAWAHNPFLVDHAVQALAAGREQPRAAGAAMSAWFRRTRRLGSKDRRRVAQLAYGVVRHEALLRRVAEARAEEDGAGDAALVAAFGRLCAGERFPEVEEEDPVEAYACALSLPRWLAGEWLARLGEEEAVALARALAGRAPTWLRADAGRGSPEEAVALLAADGIDAVAVGGPWALRVEGRANFIGSRAFRDGRVEVQDLSSQAFVQAVAAAGDLRGARVLDLCAGAGGKSLALAALGARVSAFDLRAGALAELGKRAARAGHRVEILRAPPVGAFDVVVVDAPCSGTGRLMREPTVRWSLPTDGPDPQLLATQAALRDQGATLTAPGGLLAYATCSLVAAESPADAEFRWPHRDAGDGFSWWLGRVAD